MFAFAEQQAGQQIDLLLFGQTLRLGKAGGKLFRQIRPGSDIYQTKVKHILFFRHMAVGCIAKDIDDDEEGFNIFELSTNDKGEPMLKHAPLGDASPVEVREAQCVGGPLAVLDDYYGVYVTCPDDAQYRLDWIKDIYTPDMNNDYVYPNVFMSNEDTEQVSNLQADLQTYMNTQKADWIMNGTTDAEWNEYLSKLEDYGLSDYLGIMQKYLDAYYA